jgi:uncharacterized protein (DUF433 family)
MAVTEGTSHVRVDANGVAWVDDTRVKVIEVVLDQLAYGWTAEEMHLYQPHLSLAQIHSALAYYYDHQKELDAEIRRRAMQVDELRERFEDKALREKLKQSKSGS